MQGTEIREKWAEIKGRFVDAWDRVRDSFAGNRGSRDPWAGMRELVPVRAERGIGERVPRSIR